MARNKPIFEVQVGRPQRFCDKFFDLPLTELELEDVREQLELGLEEPADVMVLFCHSSSCREQTENRLFNLFSLNAFAHNLAALDSVQENEYYLLANAKPKPSLERLNELLANLGETITLTEVTTLAELGRFYFENNFLGEEYDKLPESVAAKLDYAAIGKEMHENDGGAFGANGYTLITSWPELPNKAAPLPTCAMAVPSYTLELTLSNGEKEKAWRMPCDTKEIYDYYRGGYDAAHISKVNALIPLTERLWANDTNIEALNTFANCLQRHQREGLLALYKAAIGAHRIRDIRDAITLSDHLEDFCLVEGIRSKSEYAKSQLSGRLTPAELAAIPGLRTLGESLMEINHVMHTDYGIIGRKDGEPILGMEDFQGGDAPQLEMT